MLGIRVDGNDPFVVNRAVQQAVQRARNGEGPTLIEAMTERIVGHYIGDAQTYRTEGELDRALANEPIARAIATLKEAGVAHMVIAEHLNEVRVEVLAASADAQVAPVADPTTAREHLYA
jgi:pyruvate dehydrogenase E1 component alpha subunit